jgi:hypothetical protein
MTQISFIEEESRIKGAKRTIKLPEITAGKFIQYTKNHSKLASVIRNYGYFNQITIMNNSNADIELSLDFNDDKTYPVPGKSTISIDEIMYQEFNIKNIDDAATGYANTITVVAGYERPLYREKMKSKKMMLGGR